MSKKFTATLEGKSYTVSLEKEREIAVNNRVYTWNLCQIDDSRFSLIIDGKVYPVQLYDDTEDPSQQPAELSHNDLGSTFRFEIKGKNYTVTIDNERSTLLKAFLKTHQPNAGIMAIRAPMPGLIVKVEVEVGQEIKAGQGLIVLEAMKMENEIKAVHPGKIQAIHVAPKKAVEKGEILISILQK
ncbi:MAG: biotin attachment protein [Ignavibacteriales bacterium]|nr:biotin attachment protein [Ignavibacteriales bacterium]MBI3788274.1 biotin attachment protein [Ignavibacteriales bacterium]